MQPILLLIQRQNYLSYFLLLACFVGTLEIHAQSTKLSFDADGFPIYSTYLSYEQFVFTTKQGETMAAYTLVDKHWKKPVIGKLTTSRFYFESVPEAKEAVELSLRKHKKFGRLGYGSMLGGFTLAGASYAISPKFGDATSPIYFGVGFLSGMFFLLKRAIVDKQNFQKCIDTFNAHQSKYLVNATSAEPVDFDRLIHFQRIYKGMSYDHGNFNSSYARNYITGEKLKGFSMGPKGEVKKFTISNLKKVLQSTPESGRLLKKASLHHTLKTCGLLTTIIGSFVIAEVAGNADPGLAIGATTLYVAGIGTLFLRSHKKIVKEAMRAYNIQQVYPDYYSQNVLQSKITLTGLAFQPINLGGHRSNVLSLQFEF